VLAHQRQVEILDRVRESGAARVGDLASELRVSEMTIRRDLDALAGRGLLTKVHGGATLVRGGSADEPGFSVKASRQPREKAAIAAEAASLVGPGTAIAISAGTTTAELARCLVSVPDLTVVTNSIPVADVLWRFERPDRTVVLTGGVRTPSDALVGPVAVASVASLHVDLLFLGVHGMSEQAGFTTPNLLEAEIDRALVSAAQRVVVLADHAKWGLVGLASIARLSDAHVLITDARTPQRARAVLAEHVAQLVVADVTP
jgi:DeoR/GlpR family transcriptional regulator of sugar metabolism